MKYCKFCQSDKPLNQFVVNKKFANGVNNKCKQCVKEYRQIYNKTNKEKILKYNVKYNKIYNSDWGKKNPHIIKWRSLLYRCLIYKDIKKNGKTQDILGYSVSEFRRHIESQFKNEMRWDNIHVDHRIPLSWFNKDTPPNIVNHLSNIHPLISGENISKLNRYSHLIDEVYFSIVKEWIFPQYIDQINTTIR